MESDKDEQAKDANTDEAPAPLNRAERRALEHKKGKTTGGGQSGFGGNQARPTGRFAGGPGKTILPRTGHK